MKGYTKWITVLLRGFWDSQVIQQCSCLKVGHPILASGPTCSEDISAEGEIVQKWWQLTDKILPVLLTGSRVEIAVMVIFAGPKRASQQVALKIVYVYGESRDHQPFTPYTPMGESVNKNKTLTTSKNFKF